MIIDTEQELHPKLKKKAEVAAHNLAYEKANAIKDNIFSVGQCECNEGVLFMFMASEDANIFNVYCTDCEKVADIRRPDESANKYWTPITYITDVLKTHYGEERINPLL